MHFMMCFHIFVQPCICIKKNTSKLVQDIYCFHNSHIFKSISFKNYLDFNNLLVLIMEANSKNSEHGLLSEAQEDKYQLDLHILLLAFLNIYKIEDANN